MKKILIILIFIISLNIFGVEYTEYINNNKDFLSMTSKNFETLITYKLKNKEYNFFIWDIKERKIPEHKFIFSSTDRTYSISGDGQKIAFRSNNMIQIFRKNGIMIKNFVPNNFYKTSNISSINLDHNAEKIIIAFKNYSITTNDYIHYLQIYDISSGNMISEYKGNYESLYVSDITKESFILFQQNKSNKYSVSIISIKDPKKFLYSANYSNYIHPKFFDDKNLIIEYINGIKKIINIENFTEKTYKIGGVYYFVNEELIYSKEENGINQFITDGNSLLKVKTIKGNYFIYTYDREEKNFILIDKDGIKKYPAFDLNLKTYIQKYDKGIELLQIGFDDGVEEIKAALEKEELSFLSQNNGIFLSQNLQIDEFIRSKLIVMEYYNLIKNGEVMDILYAHRKLLEYIMISCKTNNIELAENALTKLKNLKKEYPKTLKWENIEKHIVLFEALIISTKDNSKEGYYHILNNNGILYNDQNYVLFYLIDHPEYFSPLYEDKKKLSYFTNIQESNLKNPKPFSKEQKEIYNIDENPFL
ncbi:hypothetical protein [Oceanotoga teriensis]|jgi:hypothetical protein|uniref:hypothetical protein n=1 Tax=Oceanotoga teriensis TaxID=515440 RepID=UPI002712AFA9|nr:hypothetical protein [Oceanotoga teriensis]MDO7977787.1 hypothetical protein [Oceanotoga teriensis]